MGGQGVELVGRRKVFFSLLDHQLALLEHVHDLDPDQRGLGGRKRLESEHGTRNPFDAAMILFHQIIEIIDLAGCTRPNAMPTV